MNEHTDTQYREQLSPSCAAPPLDAPHTGTLSTHYILSLILWLLYFDSIIGIMYYDFFSEQSGYIVYKTLEVSFEVQLLFSTAFFKLQ